MTASGTNLPMRDVGDGPIVLKNTVEGAAEQ